MKLHPCPAQNTAFQASHCSALLLGCVKYCSRLYVVNKRPITHVFVKQSFSNCLPYPKVFGSSETAIFPKVTVESLKQTYGNHSPSGGRYCVIQISRGRKWGTYPLVNICNCEDLSYFSPSPEKCMNSI